MTTDEVKYGSLIIHYTDKNTYKIFSDKFLKNSSKKVILNESNLTAVLKINLNSDKIILVWYEGGSGGNFFNELSMSLR